MISLEKVNPHIRFAKTLSFCFVTKYNSVCLDCRLFFLKKGSGIITINGTEYVFAPDTLVYLPPYTKYILQFDNYTDITMLVFNFDLTSKFSDITQALGSISESEFSQDAVIAHEIPEEFSKPIVLPHMPQLFKPLTQCINEFFNKEPFYSVSISAKFKLALIELLKESPQYGCNSLILQIYDYIHTKCDLSVITPAEIARHFHYHPYYLSQIMKKNIGKTLQQYLTYYRIKTAKYYLTTSNMDISFIGSMVGFNSTAYFIKVFRESTGKTPMQYRNSHTVF